MIFFVTVSSGPGRTELDLVDAHAPKLTVSHTRVQEYTP